MREVVSYVVELGTHFVSIPNPRCTARKEIRVFCPVGETRFVPIHTPPRHELDLTRIDRMATSDPLGNGGRPSLELRPPQFELKMTTHGMTRLPSSHTWHYY